MSGVALAKTEALAEANMLRRSLPASGGGFHQLDFGGGQGVELRLAHSGSQPMLHDFLKLGLKCAKRAAFTTGIVGGH